MRNLLYRWWGRLAAPFICRYRLRIHLKSGASLVVYCDDFEVTFEHGGGFKSYKTEGGARATLPVHIDVRDIVAIQREG